ncbi:MAG: alpha-ketoacid dehydrogenase subunit beta [Actinobacteria bacterium]|nr:alpha-ketoacid dehydrogenase subunit beta [Actinomycetota bacterium]
MIKKRQLPFSLAINEALDLMMAKDKRVFVIGQGVKSPWYVGNTTRGLLKKYGEQRIIDTPVSENAITGCGVGAAIAGMRPVIVHPRVDFLMYGLDPIINQAANWNYMFGGDAPVSVVFWLIVNRGGEQGAQHSQALHALFSHIPGLKVVMPSNPYDAKGLLISAIEDNNPVVYIDDRWLYNTSCFVPEGIYRVPIGKAVVRKKGKDITIAALSCMVKEALIAADSLRKEGISAEIIDLRSAKPLDRETIFTSVKKTGRLIVVDNGWLTCGLSAEVSALVSEKLFKYLKSAVQRIALPDLPAPASRTLEKAYYPGATLIVKNVKQMLRKGK